MPKANKTIEVNAPVEACFRKYTNYVEFPRFMQNVKEVTVSEDGKTLHWDVKGPLGADVEFDAVVTERIENQKIAWASVEDSDIKTLGNTTFEKLGDNQTRLHCELLYEAPAGKLGEAVAKLFSDPQDMLDEDLKNYKQQVEKEKAVTTV